MGFAGFNLLAFTGLEHTEPQNVALVTALAPLLTALVLWIRRRVRPGGPTLVLLAAALVGTALVIGHGDLASVATGSIGWGDALVLGGTLSFIFYMLGQAEFADFSALRFTALTAGFGWLSIAAATVVATAAGLVPAPSGGDVWAISPQIAYISVLGAVVAVLAWNAAIGKVGVQNTVLFGNLIPVTTFAIEIARGYDPVALELVGAAITIGALVAANLIGRGRAARRARRTEQALRRPLPAHH
jgi:drug/metabolite transporter (DMT)-like permease